MMTDQRSNDAVYAQREKYIKTLLDGFSLPVLTVFDSFDCIERDFFDIICNAVREAFAGQIVYLKRFDYQTGYEGYFVIDIPCSKAQSVLNRIAGYTDGFAMYEIKLYTPEGLINYSFGGSL